MELQGGVVRNCEPGIAGLAQKRRLDCNHDWHRCCCCRPFFSASFSTTPFIEQPSEAGKNKKQNTPWLKTHLLHSSHRSLLLPSLVWFWQKDKRERRLNGTDSDSKKKKAIIYWTSKKNLGEDIYIYIYTRTHTYTWRVEERLQRGVVAGSARLSAIANPLVQNSNSEFLIQQQRAPNPKAKP